MRRERAKDTAYEHEQVREDGDDQVCAVQTRQERQVDQDQRGRQHPVNVADPVHLAEDVLVRVRDVTVGFVQADVVVGDAVAGGHGEVGDEGDGGHQCRQRVEHAFWLVARQFAYCTISRDWRIWITYHWHSGRQDVEDERGNPHEHRDDPEIL